MTQRGPLLFDVVESPLHPDLAGICADLGWQHMAFTRQRKAMLALKQHAPDLVVADFFYGYGNNYAGANVSNLDVLLRSVQRFAPGARIAVLAEPAEHHHVDKLASLFTLDAVVRLPTDTGTLRDVLEGLV
jgi:hypothetical protein